MRVASLVFASLLMAAAAQAQTAPSPLTGSVGTPNGPANAAAPAASTAPAPAAPAPAAPTRRRSRTLAERFDAANTTHDGHLTLSQARAGHMNAVARDFAAIDKDRKGFVTMDEIRTFQREQRAARRAARAAQPAPATAQ